MKIMEGATATIINKETGETIMKVENVKVTMRKKRLKKDCPCHKCHHWRAEREIRKMHSKLAAEFKKSTEGQVVFRTPISVDMTVLGPTSPPNPQNLPRTSDNPFGVWTEEPRESRLNVDFTGKTKPPGKI